MMYLLLALIGPATAGPATTRDALDRLEEILELRIEDGIIDPDAVMPALLVSTQPRYEGSAEWFAASSIEVIEGAFGAEGLRLCEACMAPRAYVEEGRMVYQTGPVSLEEVARLDEQHRGDASPARSAIWIDEHRGGVAIRIVSLDNAKVLFAQNIDPDLIETQNTARMYTLSEELERRARGDSITQAFVDFAVYPQQHVSLDWTEQWGPRNRNLSGVTISLFDPVVGIGAAHYRSTRLFNTLIGGKAIVSLPTAITRSVLQDGGGGDILDPLLTIVGVARVPFGRSNYGAVVTVSTNGRLGIGISLMNISLLPFLP